MIRDYSKVDGALCNLIAKLTRKREELDGEIEKVEEALKKAKYAQFVFSERCLEHLCTVPKCPIRKRPIPCLYRGSYAKCLFDGELDEKPCYGGESRYDRYTRHCDDVYDRWRESCTR